MDSPNKSQLILVSDSQESPFYRYLCDLSPIKPARSVHVAQTYSELSLPPPPAVFTSPPSNSHRPSEATNETVYTQPSNGYAAVSRPAESGQSLGDRGQNLGSQSSVGQSLGGGQRSADQSLGAQRGADQSLGGQSNADQSHGGQSSADQSYGGQSNADQSHGGHQSSADQSHGGQSSADQSHGGQCSADQSHGCQHTADPSHGGQSSATSLNGFVCSPSRPDPADVELYLSDLADAMSDESLHYGEVHHEKEHLQLSHSTSRVGVPGQRGVRRRCLDFEAAEARRKSMGNGVPRRCGAGSAEVASGAYLAVGGSIPPQVLSERAGSQSGATNSSRSPAEDADNQGPGRVDVHQNNEVLQSSLMRMSRCSSAKAKEEQMIEHSHSSRDVLPSPSVGIPSGIGLHLNSLAGSTVSFSPSRAFNCTMGMSTASLLGLTPMSALKDDPIERSYTPSVSGGNLSVVSTAAFATGGCVSVVEITREERQGINLADTTMVGNLKATTCFRSVTLGVKSIQSRLPMDEQGTERKASPKRLMPPQEMLRQSEVDLADEFFESPRSPKKRRKSAAPADKSNEGCRRCNCKKSKCLKLYCECFAAGIYCVGSCTCQDCLNKPEFEEKVLETRHLIESRNPLAFAPKIVHAKDNSPTSDECNDTPASARHKRGCNCKKSLCLKKYCECYQAGVGCSEGCRCEGCQNMFGKKEAFAEEQEEHMSQDALDENELLENSLEVQQLLGGPMRSDRLRSGNKDWSPNTPSFPQSGQGRSSSRLRAAVKKRSCRDTPASPVAVKSAPRPPRSPVKPPRLTRAAANPRTSATNVRGPSQYSRNMHSPVSTPKSRIATLSPRWDGLPDICALTPLPQPQVRATPASASTVDRSGASPSFNRQCAELGSTYSGPPVRGCEFTESCSPVFKHPDSQSPATRSASNCNHFQSPLHPQHTPASTHPTPPTPSLSSSQGTVGSKPFYNPDMLPACLSFDSAAEDDTPEILKYAESVQSPQILTKTSSPKQIKRVSPPHYDGLLKDRGSRILSPGSGSPGLRNGRKFILQALPSFPSLTQFSTLRGQFNSG